jgi:hypothetical protein
VTTAPGVFEVYVEGLEFLDSPVYKKSIRVELALMKKKLLTNKSKCKFKKLTVKIEPENQVY